MKKLLYHIFDDLCEKQTKKKVLWETKNVAKRWNTHEKKRHKCAGQWKKYIYT